MTLAASRIAGRRLLGIILVLILPVALLGYLSLKSLREDIAFTQSELSGMRVLNFVLPSHFGKLSGTLDVSGVDAAHDAILADAEALGLQKEVERFTTDLKTTETEEANHVEETHNHGEEDEASGDGGHLVHEIGAASRLLLDPGAETFFLALTSVINLPDVIEDFLEFSTEIDKAVASAGVDHQELKSLLFQLGNIDEAVERSLDSLEHAQNSSVNPDIYKNALALTMKIETEVGVVKKTIIEAQNGSEGFMLGMIATQNLKRETKLAAALSVWDDSAKQLTNLLEARLSGLWQKLLILMTVAATCVAAAGIAAYWMFSSTFKKLDMVELERNRANAALLESEHLSEKVTEFNASLALLNGELESKVKSLGAAQDELLKKGRMEQLGQLTATIAHEIRNPLGSVRTSAFLLERKLKNAGLGVEPQIERINKGVVRCDSIITQLLDYSRTKQVNATMGDLEEWLINILKDETRSLPERMSIECELGLNGRQVPFDAARLQRAIINLVANASEAMSQKEAVVAMGERIPCIKVLTSCLDDRICIAVEDNGPGMPPDVLSRIREPLFTTKSFGTGLGIPAVEQIAVQHGGELLISSTPGVGSIFTICIPSYLSKLEEAA